MSSFGQCFMTSHPTATIVRQQPVVNVGALNTIVDAVCNVGIEAPEEKMPTPSVFLQAADLLHAFPINKAEISPFYGEVNITWKNGSDRVKATFGPEPGMFFVYKECFENGRVTFSDLDEHANEASLRQSLYWLNTHHPNVR
jgi:hypothetical protein